MSDAGDSARVHILLADYAVADAGNKLTVVGGGISIAGSIANTGLTAPFAVIAIATFDPAFVGESPAVELMLEDQSGQPVALPGAVGPMGQPQYVRVGVTNQLHPARVENQQIPTNATRPSVQILLNFQTGLPLMAGQRYTWRVRIDGNSSDEWTEWLYVPSPAAGAVVG
jgi:hypothetical protein